MSVKLTFLVGLGAGYVLGTRSGREQYDKLSARARELWSDPRVQERAGQAQQLVKEKAGQAQRAVTDAVRDRVSSSSEVAPPPFPSGASPS